MIRLVVAATLVLLPSLAWAQSDFSIRVFGSADTEAPSTPVIAAVVPVATDQIDVSWTASTDNFLVFGYVVVRDGIPIATTTATNFIDIGLTASTTYEYEIVAFDTVPNYSSSSIAVGTTTLQLAPPEPVSTSTSSVSTQSTLARVVLDDLRVSAGVTGAMVDVSVRQPARVEVRIGRSPNYEIGYFVGSVYRRDHSVPINDLIPNTIYYYEVVGYSPWGQQTILGQGTFVTRSDAPPAPPANVQSFVAQALDVDVELTWQLPADMPRDAQVRIVRSHLGFPQSINDGVVVYEGRGEQVQDTAVLGQYNTLYYTAFVIDPAGLISSGAITVVQVQRASESVITGDGIIPTPLSDRPIITQVPPDPNMPQPGDLQVWQDGVQYSFASSAIPLRSDGLFIVSVEAEAITGPFKTIIASLSDPRDSTKSFSFLLRLNADETAYMATIAPVQFAGVSELMVEIYDFDARVVGSYSVDIEFSGGVPVASSTLEIFWWQIQSWLWAILLVVPFIVLTILWFVFRRRDLEDEDKTPV